MYSIPLQKQATRVILIHHHSTGSLAPSESDKDTIKRLVEAGRILHIELLDYVIFTAGSLYSATRDGWLKKQVHHITKKHKGTIKIPSRDRETYFTGVG